MFTQSTPAHRSASLFTSPSSSTSPAPSSAPSSNVLLPISHTRLRGGLHSLAGHPANSTSQEQRATTRSLSSASQLLDGSPSPSATSLDSGPHVPHVPHVSSVASLDSVSVLPLDNPPGPPSPPPPHPAPRGETRREPPHQETVPSATVQSYNTTDSSYHNIVHQVGNSYRDENSNQNNSGGFIIPDETYRRTSLQSLGIPSLTTASARLTRSGSAVPAATIGNRHSSGISPTNDSTSPELEPDTLTAAPTLSTEVTTFNSADIPHNPHLPSFAHFVSSPSAPTLPATSSPSIISLVRRRSHRESLQPSQSSGNNSPSDSAAPAAIARLKSRSLLLRLRQSHSESSPASVTATNIQTTTSSLPDNTTSSPGYNTPFEPAFSASNYLSATTDTTTGPVVSLPLSFSDFPTTISSRNPNGNTTTISDGFALPLIARATNRPSYIPRTAVNDPNYSHAAMTRTRSVTSAEAEAAPVDQQSAPTLPSIRFSTYLDPRSHRPSLTFTPVSRTLPTGGEVIRVGRYSERDGHAPVPNGTPSAAPVGFKSKVVSRRHCEFWYENNRWYIKDVKSSSGTFLNHIRLSPPGTESKPFPVNDGDIVQLGIDFKGGEEMIFRCVKMRLELNRNWQTKLNAFNMTAHSKLKAMAMSGSASSYTQDCSICLNSIAPCQSLFVAPCSHTWHYKCVRTLLSSAQYPIFVCPNCRATTDLEMDPEEPDNSHLEEWQKFNGAPEALEDVPAQLAVQPVVHPALAQPQQNGDQPQRERSTPAEETAVLTGPAGQTVDAETTVLAVDMSGASPVPIPRANTTVSPDPSRGHSRTETPHGVPAIAIGHEGPITPRNDAGPWVFDGSAGRPGQSAAPNGVASLDGAIDRD